jgi:hypothetical protein
VQFITQDKNGIQGIRKDLERLGSSTRCFAIVDFIAENVEVVDECEKIDRIAAVNTNISVIKYTLLISYFFRLHYYAIGSTVLRR